MNKLLVLLLMLLLPIGTHAEIPNLNPVDAGAEMITNGIDGWVVNQADGCMNLGQSNCKDCHGTWSSHHMFPHDTSNCASCHSAPTVESCHVAVDPNTGTIPVGAPYTTTSERTVNLLQKIAAWSPDPFENDAVKHMWSAGAVIAILIGIIYIFVGGTYVVIATAFPDKGRSLIYLIEGKHTSNASLSEYVRNLIIYTVAFIFLGMVMYVVLLANTVVTTIIVTTCADSFIPHPSNAVLYFAMAVCYLVLVIFFAIRIIVIWLAVGGCFVIAACAVSDHTRPLAKKLLVYFVSIVFMQSIISAIVAFSTTCVKWLLKNVPPELRGQNAGLELTLYFATLLIALWVAWRLTFGKTKLIGTGKKVVKLVM